jgi:hypothetical protein
LQDGIGPKIDSRLIPGEAKFKSFGTEPREF